MTPEERDLLKQDERFGIRWDPALTSGNGDTDPVELAEGLDTPDLPFEPAESGEAGRGDKDAFAELRLRHLSPRGGDRLTNLWPALLLPYRDLTRVRHEYPVVFPLAGVPRPLALLLDDAVSRVTEEGDERERVTRHAYAVEALIRNDLEVEGEGRLLTLWDRAADGIAHSKGLKGAKKDVLTKDLSTVRDALGGDGDVLPCTSDVPGRMLRAAAVGEWRSRSRSWRDDVAALREGLQDVLRADQGHSPLANSPERLRSSVGSDDDVDLVAMSDILNESHVGDVLPDTRRRRIEQAIADIDNVRSLFLTEAPSEDDEGDALLYVDTILGDCRAAVEFFEARERVLVRFFRAVRIARLETSNTYREAIHDAFFDAFTESYLTDEERRMMPPVLVSMDPEGDTHPEALISMLGSWMPVKVLVCSRRLIDERGVPSWAAGIGTAAAALGSAFVLQSPLSRMAMLYDQLMDGLRFDGPALFSVFVGEGGHDQRLSPYLGSAAATESRLFPSFVFDPARGDRWIQRMKIADNRDVDQDWVTASFMYRASAGEERVSEIGFTPAELLFCDPAFNAHYHVASSAAWHESMVPFHEFLELDEESAAARVPYIVAVDDDGRIHRVVASQDVVRIARRVRSAWRNIQELGGVHNSFAEHAIDTEKAELQKEKQREVDAIETRYREALEGDVGELTKEIVQRIAAQLLGGESMPAFPTLSASAPPPKTAPQPKATRAAEVAAPAAPAEAPQAPASEEDEDDDVGGLDDAYIDTPLCTSCNECTQLNSRIFAYNGNKQAFVKDPAAGPFADLVRAAELCPVHIIHPGKPKNPAEPDLDGLVMRAAKFN